MQNIYQRCLSVLQGVKRMLCFVCLSIYGGACFSSIASGADRIIDQVDPKLNIGIDVVDVTTGVTLYQRNQNKLFIPASNMKLFSDAAALMILGPDYRFRNQLSMGDAELANGKLQGDLYLKLPGDPSFNRTRLAELLASLKSWGITHIHGNVIIDSDHAPVNPYAPGWVARDLTYSYGAPLAPLMIDANRMLVTVNPADRPGEKAVVEVDGDNGSIAIDNQVTTKPRGNRCGVSLALKDNNELNVRGCVTIGQWAIQEKMAIRNPMIYAQRLIKQLLIDEGITLDGQVTLGKMPAGTFVLATDTSKPIAQLMADTLKPSDNLYADSLFLHAAAKLNNGVPANWDQAQKLVKNFLQNQTGISLDNAVLRDGSGLSRNDELTSAQTVSLLRFLFEKFPLTYEYIAALPISGRDGTLQRRFKRPGQQDLVRAKTGTMTGIVSLSGYLYTSNAHTLAFAIFINNVPGTKPSVSGRYRYVVDALCTYFLQQKPGNNAWSKIFSTQHRIQYQQMPAQAELQRSRIARWRQLEMVVKNAVQGKSVAVIFRGNELLLRDNQPDVSSVYNALRNLRSKYRFAVALESTEKVTVDGNPLVLWSRIFPVEPHAKRVWVIHEATG